ncbi:hypothetical protein KFL_000340430 [Klebsormidium nitens]|uniref:Uncharacterized protein n=1 Tax=Klebsormidium nitens TaxID=105231 RepID=A0A1Y1HRL9_KLENI|nr:hypothetical protein KFL_000340430 [Klebsormidium nitens]|eukprot:GAQ79641.1 hypothetical protein KFL_000340430 [Klebsormidium nitens]
MKSDPEVTGNVAFTGVHHIVQLSRGQQTGPPAQVAPEQVQLVPQCPREPGKTQLMDSAPRSSVEPPVVEGPRRGSVATKGRPGRVARRHMKANASLVASRQENQLPSNLRHRSLLADANLKNQHNLAPSQYSRFYVPPEAGAGVFNASGYTSFHGAAPEHFPPALVPMILSGSFLPTAKAVQVIRDRERNAKGQPPSPSGAQQSEATRPAVAQGAVPLQRSSSATTPSPQALPAQSVPSAGPDLPVPQRPPLSSRTRDPDDETWGYHTVPQRLLRLMSFGKQRLLEELRMHQLPMDDDDKEQRSRYRWQKKEPETRGPLSEGNRPRGIWGLEEVQALMIEILGDGGLNLFGRDGKLLTETKTGQHYKTLQTMFGKDGRDLIETLLRSDFSRNQWVVKLEARAGRGEHFLRADSVARQLIRFMDKLLYHMEARDAQPSLEAGDWRVQLSDVHKRFIQSRLGELIEEVAPEDRKYPSEEIRYTHFDAFVREHRQALPVNITAAYLRTYVLTLVDQELPLEVWAEQTMRCKIALDKASERNGRHLSRSWAHPTPEQLANIVRMFKRGHPLRREDRRLRFALAAANEFSDHFGLSVASIDKIVDGKGSAGYRIYLPKYREFLAQYEADPDGFYLTFEMVQLMGNIQLSILFDNLAKAEADFRLYAAYIVEVGQFVPERYAKYFNFPTLEAAEADVEKYMAASRKVVEGNVDDCMGENSWFARQMKHRQGDKTKTKGRQLRAHPRGEDCQRVAGPGLQSGALARKAGVHELLGHGRVKSLAYLIPGESGSFRDPLELKSLEILGQDTDGNLLEASSEEEGSGGRSGQDSGGEREGGDRREGVSRVHPAVASGRAEPGSPVVPPLPFKGLHGSWGSVGRVLDDLTADRPPPSPRYRRRGLTIDGAPPVLANLRSTGVGPSRDDAEQGCAAAGPSHAGGETSGAAPRPRARRTAASGLHARGLTEATSAPARPQTDVASGSARLTSGEGGISRRVTRSNRRSLRDLAADDKPDGEGANKEASQHEAAAPGKQKEPTQTKSSRRRQRTERLNLSDREDSDTETHERADPRYPGLPAFLPPGAPRRVRIGYQQMEKL